MVELLVVMALIGIISSILLTALSRARLRAQAIVSLNNVRNISIGWHGYSEDNMGKLAYNRTRTNNPGGGVGLASTGGDDDDNWISLDNVLDWSLNPANTNYHQILDTGLGPYAGNYKVYHCPSDNVLSSVQMQAGWESRIRSYSMNAMVGDPGAFSAGQGNVNNPGYEQYYKYTAIEQPSEIFVLLEEHPDSINDGYFVNTSVSGKWTDLPASHHNGATAMSFADLHCELHRWLCDSTLRPHRPGGASYNGVPLPYPVPANQPDDFKWITKHSSYRTY